MTRILSVLVMLFAAHCCAADYVIPLEDDYSYVVTVTDSQPKSIFIADTSGGTTRRIPQTVRFDRGNFSIVCDLKLQRGNSTVYALVSQKGSILVSEGGIPSIDGKVGKLVDRTH